MQKNWKTWIAVTWALALALLVFSGGLGVDLERPSTLVLFLGRLHPSVVHLPIGILLLGVLLSWLAGRPRFEGVRPAVGPVLLLGAVGAVAAVWAGLALSTGGGYEESLLAWHKRLGIGVAVAALLAYVLLPGGSTPSSGRARAYHLSLLLLASLLAVGGHLGGALTHGAGYLTQDLPPPLLRLVGLGPEADSGNPQVDDLGSTAAYDGLIRPILSSRCTNCHNPDKRKGGLLLDTPEGLMKGGDDGPVVTAGDPVGSALIQRIMLPPLHKDHMPPRGHLPLTPAQATLLSWWIEQGAPFDTPLAEMTVTPAVQLILDGYGLGDQPRGIFALDVPPPDTLAFQALRAAGLQVEPLAGNVPFVQVRARNNRAVTDETLALLQPLAAQIAWLDLAGTAVSSEGLRILSAFPHLTRLHLERTNVGDASLTHLAGLEYLAYLNLYGTGVTDEGLATLALLPGLQALYLWQTPVTQEAAEQLRRSQPHLQINLGLPTTPPSPTSQP